MSASVQGAGCFRELEECVTDALNTLELELHDALQVFIKFAKSIGAEGGN